MSLRTITVEDYITDTEARRLADEVMTAGQLPPDAVCLIEESEPGLFACTLLVRDGAGKHVLTLDRQSVATRTVEVRLP